MHLRVGGSLVVFALLFVSASAKSGKEDQAGPLDRGDELMPVDVNAGDDAGVDENGDGVPTPTIAGQGDRETAKQATSRFGNSASQNPLSHLEVKELDLSDMEMRKAPNLIKIKLPDNLPRFEAPFLNDPNAIFRPEKYMKPKDSNAEQQQSTRDADSTDPY
ncbi:uncharacterized protein [Ptychodera flava]|uniref:uncharacterized protein n=1 Tax=Ptychodera flava TaxID=63121 RepID=UPI00396A1BA1